MLSLVIVFLELQTLLYALFLYQLSILIIGIGYIVVYLLLRLVTVLVFIRLSNVSHPSKWRRQMTMLR